MRILHILRNRWIGGAEKIVGWLAHGLTEQGHRVFVACPPDSWLEDELADIPGCAIPEAMRGLPGLRSLRAHHRLCRLVKREGIQLIHTHLRVDSFYGAWVARSCGIPLVRSLHLRGDADSTIFQADCVAPVSQALANHLRELGVASERIHVCYAGIDLNRFRPFTQQEQQAARRELGGIRTPVVGMVSRLRPGKGAETLLRAAAELPDFQVLLVGYGKPAYEELLHQIVHDLGLWDRVAFAGKQEDVRPFLAAMDMLALPSRDEGLPISLLEAMGSGVPVVATPAGGTPEILQDGETGLMIPFDDHRALASALSRLCYEPVLALNLRANALALVSREFSIPRMVERTLDIYQQTLARR